MAGSATAPSGTPTGLFMLLAGGSGLCSFTGSGLGDRERLRLGLRLGRRDPGLDKEAGIVTVPPSCF